jgi:multiple sugar transport system substrate-binding protein
MARPRTGRAVMRSGRRRVAIIAASVAGLACAAQRRDGDVELRFWGMGREGEVVQELARGFERENPGIRVRVQQIPWSAAHEKLLTAHVGNATPDIAQLGNTWIAEFSALDALVPLDSLVAQSTVVAPQNYFPGIWKTNVVDSTLYGVAWYVDTRVVFYRTDLLAKAGYAAMPTTWAEWRTAMATIRQQGGAGKYGILLPTNEWPQPVIFGQQAGSTLLANGGREGAFSDSAFRAGFDFYTGLFRDSLAPSISSNQISNIYQEFANGTYAMIITGPWNIGEFRRRLPADMQDKWGTAPLPGPTGAASGVSTAGGASLVIFRGSKHKTEAWKLLEYLSRPDQQLAFWKLTGDLPAHFDAWKDPALIGDKYTKAFWEQLQRVEPLPAVPEIELIVTKVFETGEKVVQGGTPVARALEDLDRQVDAILEKRRWMLDRAKARAAAGGTGAQGGGG